MLFHLVLKLKKLQENMYVEDVTTNTNIMTELTLVIGNVLNVVEDALLMGKLLFRNNIYMFLIRIPYTNCRQCGRTCVS
jgi:hypothetical protein